MELTREPSPDLALPLTITVSVVSTGSISRRLRSGVGVVESELVEFELSGSGVVEFKLRESGVVEFEFSESNTVKFEPPGLTVGDSKALLVRFPRRFTNT